MQKKEFSKNNTLALKGIAIIMMMFHHCFWNKSLYENFKISFFPLNETIVVNVSAMFKICVSIFVFITGYGLMLSLKKLNAKYEWTNKEIIKWISSRLIKTLSGFWIVAILAYIICQAINGMTGKVFFTKGISSGIIKMIINLLGLSKLFGLNTFDTSWWYMSIAILFIFSIPIFAKTFKKYGYGLTLTAIIFIPRIIGWKYVNSSYISFLFPLILGMIFAKENLLVKFANFKICKNIYLNKVIKFIIETICIIVLYEVYNQLPIKQFWEIKYGVIPVFLICYLYEFFIEIPVVKQVLEFIGKYSMDIFLIHALYRDHYLNEFIYSFRNWLKIATVLFGISLLTAILLELFKKLIRYDKLIDKLQKITNNSIDNINNRKSIGDEASE